jgi:hypothetical protein
MFIRVQIVPIVLQLSSPHVLPYPIFCIPLNLGVKKIATT